MKKTLILSIIALAAVAVTARAQSTQYGVELRGSLNYWAPDFDLYDFAYGVDIGYRNWLWDPVGFALGVGVSSWEVKGGSSAVNQSALKDIDGQLTTIPVGPSIIYKIADMTDWNLTAEAGIRYVFAQSAIDYKRADTGEAERSTLTAVLSGSLGWITSVTSTTGSRSSLEPDIKWISIKAPSRYRTSRTHPTNWKPFP